MTGETRPERAVIVEYVTAELRGMAQKVSERAHQRHGEWQAEKGSSRDVFQGMWLGLADAERMLHARADELDPRASEQRPGESS